MGRKKSKEGLPPISAEERSLLTDQVPHIKLKALYVGNLGADASSEKLSTYVSQRSSSLGEKIEVDRCSLTEKASGKEWRGAHIVVPARCAKVLLKKSFWPKPVYARHWVFQESSSEAITPKFNSGAPLQELHQHQEQLQQHQQQEDDDDDINTNPIASSQEADACNVESAANIEANAEKDLSDNQCESSVAASSDHAAEPDNKSKSQTPSPRVVLTRSKGPASGSKKSANPPKWK